MLSYRKLKGRTSVALVHTLCLQFYNLFLKCRVFFCVVQVHGSARGQTTLLLWVLYFKLICYLLILVCCCDVCCAFAGSFITLVYESYVCVSGGHV